MCFRYASSLLAESFEVTAVGAVVAAQSLATCVMNLDMGTEQSRGPWLDKASECAGRTGLVFYTIFSGRIREVHVACGSLLHQVVKSHLQSFFPA